MSHWLKIRKRKKVTAMMIVNVKYMFVYSGLQEEMMKFLRNLLGIGTLEEKLEEVYLHCVRANAQTGAIQGQSGFEKRDTCWICPSYF